MACNISYGFLLAGIVIIPATMIVKQKSDAVSIKSSIEKRTAFMKRYLISEELHFTSGRLCRIGVVVRCFIIGITFAVRYMVAMRASITYAASIYFRHKLWVTLYNRLLKWDFLPQFQQYLHSQDSQYSGMFAFCSDRTVPVTQVQSNSELLAF